jgi:hypothetical protein
VVVAATSGSLLLGAQPIRAISSPLFAELTWRCVGPFDGGPVASVEGVAGVPGVYVITTPSGGDWKTTDGGETWTSIDRPGGLRVSDPSAGGPLARSAAGDPHRWVDPANPHRVVRTTAQGIEVSLDAGATWMSFHQLPIAEVARLTTHEHPTSAAQPATEIDGAAITVSIADSIRPTLRFAGTKAGAYVSFNAGARWASLQLNMPGVAINDLDIQGNNLVAATQGRSIWTLDDITPLRQISSTTESEAALLFKPADSVLTADEVADRPPAGAYLDYYFRMAPAGAVTLEVLDASGRVVYSVSSAASNTTDRWLPVMRPLPKTAGHHRVVWNLRVDPAPSPQHRFAQLARTLYENVPADPGGPQVLAGTYRVRLTAGRQVSVQPLIVRNDPATTPAQLDARRQQFDLAMKADDAMQASHRAFLQLVGVRRQLSSLAASPDPDLVAAAADLDARLAVLDGSDWTGLVIPDADDETQEVDEKEGKHPDFVPPKAVGLNKDYDDPTSILGRTFTNVDHAPAFAILNATLGDLVTRLGASTGAPDTLSTDTYAQSCEQLAGVLDAWRAINSQDVPRLNAELTKRHRPAILPVSTSVPTIACSTAR